MYFGARTECYARHVLCTSVHAQDGDMKEKKYWGCGETKEEAKTCNVFWRSATNILNFKDLVPVK
jgi:hypothetical protein